MRKNGIQTRTVKQYLAAAATALLLAACTAEDGPAESPLPGGTVQPPVFAVRDGGYRPDADARARGTRAVTDPYAPRPFDMGEACGLYIVRRGRVLEANVKLTCKATSTTLGGETWELEKNTANNADNLNFNPEDTYYLYFPYQEKRPDMLPAVGDETAATGAKEFFEPLIKTWIPLNDQSKRENYRASDLMTAQGVLSISNKTDKTATLSFEFSHEMCLIVIPDDSPSMKFATQEHNGYPSLIKAHLAFTGESVPYRPADEEDVVLFYIGNPATGEKLFAYTSEGVAGDRVFLIELPKGKAVSGTYHIFPLEDIDLTDSCPLMAGDYFCRTADKGYYILPQDVAQMHIDQADVVGIVFYAVSERDFKGDKYVGEDYPATTTGGTGTQADWVGKTREATRLYGTYGQRFHGLVVAVNAPSEAFVWSTNGTEETKLTTKITDMQGIIDDLSGLDRTVKVGSPADRFSTMDLSAYPAMQAAYGINSKDSDPSYVVTDHSGKPIGYTPGWFLPSTGQWLDLLKGLAGMENSGGTQDGTSGDVTWTATGVIDKINASMSKLKGEKKIPFTENTFYWTATEYDNENAWGFTIENGTVKAAKRAKSETGQVRAVLAF